MLIISHRVNTITDLLNTPNNFGIEVDVRSWKKQIILQHEPYEEGVLFSEWLKYLNHKFIILNIKNEGIEVNTIKELLLAKQDIEYFLLDQSFPMFARTIMADTQSTAMRISNLESPQYLEQIKPKWVWLDSHNGNWDYLHNSIEFIVNSGSKVCIASPELHGRSPLNEINEIKAVFESRKIQINAVCTKIPENWE